QPQLPGRLQLGAARVSHGLRCDLEPAVRRGRGPDRRRQRRDVRGAASPGRARTANPDGGGDGGRPPAVNGATFGAPLPLLASGVPVCVVNSFTGSKITGLTADMSNGAIMGGRVNLRSGVFLTSATQVCPRCSGSDVGQAGTCDSGGRSGRACTTSGVVNVANAAGNKTYTLSPDCPPSGSPAGSIPIGLPLTSATSTLSGAPPCAGQTHLPPPGCGTCEH